MSCFDFPSPPTDDHAVSASKEKDLGVHSSGWIVSCSDVDMNAGNGRTCSQMSEIGH